MWFRIALAAQDFSPKRDRGHIDVHDITIYIEYPKGSIRTKTDSKGKTWSRKMATDYGRLVKGPEGADGDAIDAFVGPYIESDKVFVLNQMTREGSFDEHKGAFRLLDKERCPRRISIQLSQELEMWTNRQYDY